MGLRTPNVILLARLLKITHGFATETESETKVNRRAVERAQLCSRFAVLRFSAVGGPPPPPQVIQAGVPVGNELEPSKSNAAPSADKDLIPGKRIVTGTIPPTHNTSL